MAIPCANHALALCLLSIFIPCSAHEAMTRTSDGMRPMGGNYFSPKGDVICTSLDECRPWDPDAWKHETNECSRTVTYTGPGLEGVPKSLTVFYDDFLNGGGTDMAPGFVQVTKNYVHKHGGMERRGEGRAPFQRGFEWCTGPGYIAFAQLAAGTVSRLLLSDINPKAVRCLHKTVKHNGLEDIVKVVLGKDFDHMPVPHKDEDRIDVVWGNPPNYQNIDKTSAYSHNLRPSDPSWKTHEAFYAGIGRYLKHDALLMIEEVLPHLKDVRYADIGEPLVGGNYDTRAEVPLQVFRRMASANGLKEVGYMALPDDDVSKLLLFSPVPRIVQWYVPVLKVSLGVGVPVILLVLWLILRRGSKYKDLSA